MSVIILLILASLAVGLLFVGAFIWSVRSGQYEDTVTPSLRVLLDDAAPPVVARASRPVVAASDPVQSHPDGALMAPPGRDARAAAVPEIEKH